MDTARTHKRVLTALAFKKYNAVVQSAELLDIRLTSSKFDVKSEYYLVKQGDNNDDKKQIKLRHGGTLLSFNLLRKKASSLVTLNGQRLAQEEEISCL